MFVVFVIGLLLLVALFGVKAVEADRGYRIFLSEWRDQADDRFAKLLQEIRCKVIHLYQVVKNGLSSRYESARRSFAAWLRKAARQIHN